MLKNQSTVQKPKQTRLTLQQKVDVLKKIDVGVSGNRFSIDYDVSKQAISKINQKRKQILEVAANTVERTQRKTIQKSEYPELENKLFEWFSNQRARNLYCLHQMKHTIMKLVKFSHCCRKWVQMLKFLRMMWKRE